MQLTPDQLSSQGYALKHELPHNNILPFIRTYLKKRTLFSRLFDVFNLINMALLVWWFVWYRNTPGFSFSDSFATMGLSFCGIFLLIPIHEYLHVLAYKIRGAKNTSYKADFRKFYFMAMANRFVANRRDFFVVALMPFVTITALVLLLLVIGGMQLKLIATTILLVHTACCSGDFGLLSYFDFYKNSDIVTYDDTEQGISYFYHKQDPSTKEKA